MPSAYSARSAAATAYSRNPALRAGSGKQTALDTLPERPPQVQTESVVIKSTLTLKLSGLICMVSAVRSSYQLVLCVSELFTLLPTQNLKRFSMGCWCPIAEPCTCRLLVLQVSEFTC